MPPKVSIIIPVFNSERYLRDTIECVLNQTWRNIEVILVDDGSTDSSFSIAREYKSDTVKVIGQQNGGGSKARNTGLLNATGDFIQYLDSDDLLPPEKIEKQLKYLEATPDCLIGCLWVRFRNSPGESFGATGPHESIRRNLKPLEWLTIHHTMLIQCWLTPRLLIDQAGPWDEQLSFNDDGEYFARVVAKAKEVLFCPETIGYYRSEGSNSVSSMNSYQKFVSAYNAARSYEKVIRSLSSDENDLVRHIGNRYKEILYLCYPQYPDLVKQCLSHKEIAFADVEFETGGTWNKAFTKLLGWKAVKQIKHRLK
ncbi:MAG: glycosyltransferase family 2 protein [Sphingobacteriaceae bacterium]|jgi:glycosyltransferase involved in cell wall biosynthesis|nr:glycosyltransferase family 2 protein [Sphingobacteriaceae bacterium]